MKLSKWLKKNLKGNVKDTLEATIEGLLELNPPINRNLSVSKQKKAVKRSLQDLKDEKILGECAPLSAWLNTSGKKNKTSQTTKVVDENDHAVFRKNRFFSSSFNISYGFAPESVNVQSVNKTDNIQSKKTEDILRDVNNNVSQRNSATEDIQETKRNVKQSKRSPSPPLPQRFSFSASEQGSYVEPILQLVERALFKFITRHETNIPLKVVKGFVAKCNPPRQSDFSDADLLCLLNFTIHHVSLFTNQSDKTLFCGKHKLNPSTLLTSFKVEARNYNAHAITQTNGRWDDERLQRLSTLALEVSICLGAREEYENLLEIKKKLDFEVMERWVTTVHEDDPKMKKRKIRDIELEELTDFALDVINKLESDQEQLNRIVHMAISKDETLLNIWRCIESKEKKDKIEKFIKLMNIEFNMV
ncbi:13430_t:CDS:2 [Cetraspora pellucida]|uniref:13430_t:CDS:1 n=1 Tax=Cetraspora pellucida TaxID=1433469 RepID=A0A9N9J0R0_9GLOM|nr:13430_t:CDS:2 [Cetraspora pellucida]